MMSATVSLCMNTVSISYLGGLSCNAFYQRGNSSIKIRKPGSRQGCDVHTITPLIISFSFEIAWAKRKRCRFLCPP